MPSFKDHLLGPESEALDKSVAKREQDCPLGGCNTTMKPAVEQSGELIRCLQKRLIYSIRRHLVWRPVFPPSSALARPIKYSRVAAAGRPTVDAARLSQPAKTPDSLLQNIAASARRAIIRLWTFVACSSRPEKGGLLDYLLLTILTYHSLLDIAPMRQAKPYPQMGDRSVFRRLVAVQNKLYDRPVRCKLCQDKDHQPIYSKMDDGIPLDAPPSMH